MSNRNWREASRSEPCPICAHDHWCRLSTDGELAVCRREAASPTYGVGKKRADRNGADCWLYRLKPSANGDRSPEPPPPGADRSLASKKILHVVYKKFVGQLGLSGEHLKNLSDRGLPREEIVRLGYRTLDAGRWRGVRAVIDAGLGDQLAHVPGFYYKADKSRWSMRGSGIVIPVRDCEGWIVALKCRRDEVADGGSRYHYLSSKCDGGPGPGSPVHVPHFQELDRSVVRVTEGELKADVATALGGILTVGLPGVALWRKAAKTVAQLGAETVRVAFDMDASEKLAVAHAQANLVMDLAVKGFSVGLERWDPQHKGIDDALAAKAPIEVLAGEAMAKALAEIMAAAKKADPNGAKESDGEKKKETQGEILIEIAKELTYFHASDQKPFVVIPIGGHRETWPARSSTVRRWLEREFYNREKKAPNSDALQSTVNLMEAWACFDRPCEQVYVRVAEGPGGKVYLDLGDADWTVIEIDAEGWRMAREHPVRFRRSSSTHPLPMPEHGARIEELRPLLNLVDEESWVLYVAWLLAALFPRGPYPVLVLGGPQGSAKSTAARIAKRGVDPGAAEIRTLPRSEEDLMISAAGSWVLALDNVSGLDDWMSDALCRLSTGGGMAVRTLYTNEDETIFDARRPVILNGVTEIVARPDLLDRCLLLQLPSIPDDRRREEAEIFSAFERMRSRLLGALLDAMSGALRALPETRLSQTPRLADFARLVTAAEPALGWPSGTFLRSYTENRKGANETVIEGSLIAPLIIELAQGQGWVGTAAELLAALGTKAGETTKKSKGWPQSPRAVSSALRRLVTNLQAEGVVVVFDREAGGSRRRTITIREADWVGNGASRSSPSSRPEGETRDEGEGRSAPAPDSTVPPPPAGGWDGRGGRDDKRHTQSADSTLPPAAAAIMEEGEL